MNKIIKSVAVVTAIGLATRGLSFVYRIILTRSLTSYELGVYQLTLSFFMVLLTFTSSGIPLAVSRRTSASQGGTERHLSDIASSGLVLTLFFAIVASLFILIFKNIFTLIFADKKSYDLLLILLPALVFSCVYSSCRGSLWGRKKFLAYSLVEFFEEIVSLATLVVLVYILKPQLYKISFPVIAVTASVIGGAFFALISYLLCGGRFHFNKAELSPTLKISSPITFVRFLTTFASSILSLLLPSLLVLYGMSPQSALSLIGLVTGVAFPLLFVPSSFISSIALVLVPEISEDLAKKRNVATKIQKAFSISILVSSLVVPLYLVLGNEICELFFHKLEAGKYLIAASIAIIPMGLNQLAVSFLNASGGEKFGFTNFLIGVSVAITFVIFLTPHISIYANILSMILQPTIIFSLNLFRMSKLLKIQKRQLAKNFAFILSIIPMLAIGFFAKSILFSSSTFVVVAVTSLCIFAFFVALIFIVLFLFRKNSCEF